MRIVSVNVGTPRHFTLNGRDYTSAIWKHPVEGRIEVAGVNVVGDDQADRTVHGGNDKAVYAYATEDYAWWSAELGRPLEPGTFGENLTTEGIDLGALVVGERVRIGTVTLEAAQPRHPCFKLGVRMEDPHFPNHFTSAARWGAYFRIIDAGALEAGDEIETLSAPTHGVTLSLVGAIYKTDHTRAHELLAAPALPERVHAWATKEAGRS